MSKTEAASPAACQIQWVQGVAVTSVKWCNDCCMRKLDAALSMLLKARQEEIL